MLLFIGAGAGASWEASASEMGALSGMGSCWDEESSLPVLFGMSLGHDLLTWPNSPQL